MFPLVLFPFLFWTTAAIAGSFDVSPVRIYFDQRTKTAALTLRNTGRDTVVIQAELMSWKGREIYSPTNELLVNPPIFTLKPNTTQTVRLGSTRATPPTIEQAYRLFLQEVPLTLPKSKQNQINGLQVALRIGIPIFQSPVNDASEFQWNAKSLKNGNIRVEFINRGNSHLQIMDFTLAGSEQAVLAKKIAHQYVLSGQSESWTIHPVRSWKGGPLHISARTDRGVVHAEVQTQIP